MKWLSSFLFACMLMGSVLTGCQSDGGESQEANTEKEQQEEVNVTVNITQNNGEETVAEEELTVEEGAVLMDVMKNNFDIKEEDGFITSIEGVSAEEGEQKAWMYTINGEEASTGANEYEVKDDDNIEFDFAAWE
ncbi:DUF4430 domain-containing protein [Thalassobacillus sp. CUG 92003]|uniref:DUF4430 domain-containing protein n=1 Tax=Thalassobacillus sp. CUG 92003 TaxID=2736641 RepID=UPI0015E63632|nr:DUF4430 domain-containing protein [Thalassobacillus sp. CUG 92003]